MRLELADPVQVGQLVDRCVKLGLLAKERSIPQTTGLSSEARWELQKIPQVYRRAVWDRVRNAGIRKYADRVDEHRAAARSLLIVGPVGTGKSSAAALVAEAAAEKGLTIGWAYVPELVDQLHDGKGRSDVIRGQIAPDLLVWDDFGVGGLQVWQTGLLDRVVERRYRSGRPMVVTSNLPVKALLESDDGSITRMADRWRDGGFMAQLRGDSYRAKTA